MKLSEYAKLNSVSYKTAWRWFRDGKIKNARQLNTGTVVIDEEEKYIKGEYIVIYARVSSSENKSNLEHQAQRLIDYCAAKGWIVNEVIKEVGSGLNDSRKKLLKLFKENKATKIVVEHKDRLTRFGFNYIKELFDGEIVVINEAEDDKQDLIQDFISVITSFCARIYGQRRSKRKTEKIIKELNSFSCKNNK